MKRIIGIGIVVIFGLFYAYDLWEAIGNLFGVPAAYAALGLDRYIPYWLLWVGVIVPPVVFALALLLGRRRSLLERALILVIGLAVVAALTFATIALGDALLPDLSGVVS